MNLDALLEEARNPKRYELELLSAEVPARTHSMFSDDLVFVYEGEPHRFAIKGFLIDRARKDFARVDADALGMPAEMNFKAGMVIALEALAG